MICVEVEKWLERIAFLNFEDFDFIKKYENAVERNARERNYRD